MTGKKFEPYYITSRIIPMRELLEQGFEVAEVKDATAAAQVPEGDGYAVALVNFRFLASDVVTTDQATHAISKAK